MYIRHYFQSLLAIYQVACWFLSDKIQLVSSSRIFPQMFSPYFLEKIFCHSENFVKKEKYGNQLVPGLVNMLDEIEQTSRNSIFFPARFLQNVSFYYHWEALNISYWWVQSFYLEDFHAHVPAVESISLLFKNSKWIILWGSHPTHSITFIPWSSSFGVGSRDSSMSIHPLLNWTLS